VLLVPRQRGRERVRIRNGRHDDLGTAQETAYSVVLVGEGVCLGLGGHAQVTTIPAFGSKDHQSFGNRLIQKELKIFGYSENLVRRSEELGEADVPRAHLMTEVGPVRSFGSPELDSCATRLLPA
jgi:hypothetical protein